MDVGEKEKEWIPVFAGMTKKEKQKKRSEKREAKNQCLSVFIRGSLFLLFLLLLTSDS